MTRTSFAVTPYFNDTNGGSFAEGVDAASDLRLRDNPNPARYPMLDGYKPGDILVAARYGTTIVDADTDIDAAEKVFARMNSDVRPNGKVERSLSVGDVLLLTTVGGKVWLAVESVGFKRIEDPNAVTV